MYDFSALLPHQAREWKGQLKQLPTSFKKLWHLPRTNPPFPDIQPNSGRYGHLNLKSGFYVFILSGYYTYDKDETYRTTGFKEIHCYVNSPDIHNNNNDDKGNTLSYFRVTKNTLDDPSCDMGMYVWDARSVIGGIAKHGSILYAREMLPFEVINMKFNLFRHARRSKVTLSSLIKPTPRK